LPGRGWLWGHEAEQQLVLKNRLWNFYLGGKRGQVRRDQGGGAGGAGSVPPGRRPGGGRRACAPLPAAVPS
jgi:hypothetical protein